MSDKKIQFWLNGAIVPKARARTFSRGGKTITTLPENYRKWKKQTVSLFKANQRWLYWDATSFPVSLYGLFVNQKITKDSDNLIGAIADALFDCGFLPNDNGKYVGKSDSERLQVSESDPINPKKKLQGVLIVIERHTSPMHLVPELKETAKYLRLCQ